MFTLKKPRLSIIMIGMKSQPDNVSDLMTPLKFETLVQDYAAFDHMVFIGDHVFVDNADRRITRRMILRAIKKGTVKGEPKWSGAHVNWVGKMHYIGTGLDLTVVCAIKDRNLTVTVVTAYGKPGK